MFYALRFAFYVLSVKRFHRGDHISVRRIVFDDADKFFSTELVFLQELFIRRSGINVVADRAR